MEFSQNRLFLATLLFPGHVRVLCHAEKRGCYFQNFIGSEVFNASIKRHFNTGSDTCRDSFVCRTHVCQRLLLANIDFQVARTLVNSNNHSLVNRIARLNHHATTILGALDSKGGGSSIRKSQQRSLIPTLDFFVNLGSVRVENTVDNRRTTRGSQKSRPKSQHAPGGDKVLDDRQTFTFFNAHVLELSLALVESVNNTTRVLFGNTNL